LPFDVDDIVVVTVDEFIYGNGDVLLCSMHLANCVRLGVVGTQSRCYYSGNYVRILCAGANDECGLVLSRYVLRFWILFEIVYDELLCWGCNWGGVEGYILCGVGIEECSIDND
jgi:hypothetical protein